MMDFESWDDQFHAFWNDQRDALRRVFRSNRTLTPHGYGMSDPKATLTQIDGYQTEAILSLEYIRQFAEARIWLWMFPKTRRQSELTCYLLKGAASHQIGYCSNGMFMAAALAEGFILEQYVFTPTATLNIPNSAWEPCGQNPYVNGKLPSLLGHYRLS